MPAEHQFVLICGTAPYLRLLVSKSVVVVGRSATCDLVIADASVSRRHAELRPGEGRIEVTDLSSRNGTFVAERRVRIERVEVGDCVRFGHVAFTVSLDEAASEEATDCPGRSSWEGKDRPAGRNLSTAQRRVFELLLEGLPEKTIAKELLLSRHTIHNHTRAIFRLLGVHSRSQLLVVAAKSRGNDTTSQQPTSFQ